MPSLSFTPLLRHRLFSLPRPPLTSLLLRTASSFIVSSRVPPRKPKSLLKAKDSVKDLRSLTASPLHPSPAHPALLHNQAVGMVAAAQANFMRVVVESVPVSTDSDSMVGKELLCVVRALLKKIKRRVLVGDKVLVNSIDWVDRRGVIEDVFGRKTEIMDPPVANVDHLLVLFSMHHPKPEPLTLTRFLVEAESTGIPVTLAFNKAELVQDEIKERLAASESGKCSFSDCLHLGERGCVVKADWERYPYYLQLLDEIKIREEFQLRTLGTKREGEMRYKVGSMGVKQAEPMLEFKKHRRVSRKRINQSILDDLDDIEEVESDTEDW